MKTYYRQLKDQVLPRLQYFRDDLLKIDRGALRGYHGPLIHASRDSGTDLICFDHILTIEKFRFDLAFFFRGVNDLFFIGGDDQIVPATMRECLEYLAKQLPRIANQIARHELDQTGLYTDGRYFGALEDKEKQVYRLLSADYADAGSVVDKAAA